MVIRALLKRNTYYDSITLMSVAQAAKDLPGVEDVGAVMATEVNFELLLNSNLMPVAFLAEQPTPPSSEDLLIVLRAIDEAHAEMALAVAEERLALPAGPLGQGFGQLALRLGEPSVGDVDEPADLVADRLDHPRRAVAEQPAAPAGEKVQVAVALGVPDVRAFAAHQADRVARVVADDGLPVLVDDLLGAGQGRGHGSLGHRTISVPTPRSV